MCRVSAMNTELTLTIISVVLTVLAGAIAALARGSFFEGLFEYAQQLGRREISEVQEDGLSLRLREVRRAFDRQRMLAVIHRIASSLLTFGQFIIGGLL